MKKYDVIVIGSGMAGMTIANKCTQKSLKTAVTASIPYGGTCALRSCDTSKATVVCFALMEMSPVLLSNKTKAVVSYEI